MVEISGADAGRPEVLALAKDVAMHIAAASPICVNRDTVPADTVAHEMSIYKAQAAESGKPEAMIEKIAAGKLEKLFYKQVCLLEQGFVKDPDTSIAQLVAAAGKAIGAELTIVAFDRFVLGEGTAAAE
jgi:elongation factor Ts